MQKHVYAKPVLAFEEATYEEICDALNPSTQKEINIDIGNTDWGDIPAEDP